MLYLIWQHIYVMWQVDIYPILTTCILLHDTSLDPVTGFSNNGDTQITIQCKFFFLLVLWIVFPLP